MQLVIGKIERWFSFKNVINDAHDFNQHSLKPSYEASRKKGLDQLQVAVELEINDPGIYAIVCIPWTGRVQV